MPKRTTAKFPFPNGGPGAKSYRPTRHSLEGRSDLPDALDDINEVLFVAEPHAGLPPFILFLCLTIVSAESQNLRNRGTTDAIFIGRGHIKGKNNQAHVASDSENIVACHYDGSNLDHDMTFRTCLDLTNASRHERQISVDGSQSHFSLIS